MDTRKPGRGFQDIGRAYDVDTHRRHRTFDYRVNSRDCGTMNNDLGTLDVAFQGFAVKHIATYELEVWVVLE